MIWEGSLKILQLPSNKLELRFLQNSNIFAVCPIPEDYQEAVVKCQDSSRGFAVRLFNNGKFAWVGAAFRERSDAFDFNVCFNDWQQKTLRD
jgi:hypothetical protein